MNISSAPMDPWSAPDAWDSITIGLIFWRGKFEIKGADRKYTWNIATGMGFAGAYENFTSQPPAEFSITFYVWAASQWTQFLALISQLTYTPTHLPPTSASDSPGSALNALNIAHPQLQSNRITQVIVKKIGDLEKEGDDLMFSFTVDFIEFTKQKPIPPQVPDTAADANDPTISPEARAAIAQTKAAQQVFDTTAAGLGTPNGLPK